MADAIRLEVDNMTCAGCARRAQAALAAVPGVRGAQVNFATRAAEVTGTAPVAELAEALDRAGYPARAADTELSVSGMNCASCTAKVEGALLALPGVRAARVNLATGKVRVTHLAGVTPPEDLPEGPVAVAQYRHCRILDLDMGGIVAEHVGEGVHLLDGVFPGLEVHVRGDEPLDRVDGVN